MSIQRAAQNQVTRLLYKLRHLKPLKMSQDKKKKPLCIYLPVLLEAKHSSRAHTLQLTHRKIELYLIVLRPEYKSHVMPGDASFHQATFFSLQGATAAVRLKRLTTENL